MNRNYNNFRNLIIACESDQIIPRCLIPTGLLVMWST